MDDYNPTGNAISKMVGYINHLQMRIDMLEEYLREYVKLQQDMGHLMNILTETLAEKNVVDGDEIKKLLKERIAIAKENSLIRIKEFEEQSKIEKLLKSDNYVSS